MGRKIPGRKHRGVKDIDKQAAIRFESIRDKINTPPTNPDLQEISKTLQRIIDLKSKTKNGDFKRKKAKKINVTNDENNVKSELLRKDNGPVFKQLPSETERQFLRRVNKTCENITKQAAFEDKYGVDIVQNETGEVEVKKRPKDELEVLLKKAKKTKGKKKVVKKKKVEQDQPPKLTKSQKWQIKKKEKLLKKKKNSDEFEQYKDSVGFGEIVHAPPKLITPRKVEKVVQPGQRKLLLNNIINKNNTNDNKPKQKKLSGSHDALKKTIDKKGKRKDLPNALRRQLDKQQKEIVDAYKLLKSKKSKS